ncbi:protein sly1 homolog [Planococcus citri]|uniref:protein sly1 homolog n=1 Tax=Planococcus citri TaxID=170843 RepID=UPI0031F9C683
MTSIRKKQIDALKQMLNLNEPISNLSGETVWKVLVYDRFGQDIISPLISIKELRELGVTLHVQLHSNRDPIPDAPAIYFCMPSEENLGRISQDFLNGLYDFYHLNFITAVSRQKLEDLALAALEANVVMNISKVFDQYLNFISLEDDLFILRHQNIEAISYFAMNKGNIKDSEMESIIDNTVDGLFSAFATLGIVPVIRSPRGNAAEMVAEKLDKKLRENLRDTRNSLFTAESSYSFQRPLLIVLDRNVDIATPLHHTWTYQALAHDVLNLSLNRVVLDNKGKKKVCDLDNNDTFWMTHKGSPFPTVAEAIQEELEQLRTSEEEVKKLKASMGLDNESDIVFSMMSDNTAKLTSAVNSLPQLLERKRLIDMHTSIATEILDAIKSRRLDTLFEVEEKVMSKTSLDRSLSELIDDPEFGTDEDKLRLFLIYYICAANLSNSEIDKIHGVLEKAGCDINPINYIKRWKMYANMTTSSNQIAVGGGTKTIGMFSKLLSQGSSFVMEGVKNLVVKRHNLPVTRIVDDFLEGREPTTPDGDYRYFDPKQIKVTDVTRSKTPFYEAIVFVVGGGNYIEYQNLVDYCKTKWGGAAAVNAGRKVVYGTSVLMNAKQFLRELSLLGQEVS